MPSFHSDSSVMRLAGQPSCQVMTRIAWSWKGSSASSPANTQNGRTQAMTTTTAAATSNPASSAWK